MVLWQIGQLIPDFRKQEFVHHSYMEMVSQRIGQILCVVMRMPMTAISSEVTVP